jgi:hypothetical protein
MGGDDSIVAELTSWKRGSRPGLSRARLTTESRTGSTSVTDVLVKSKPRDTDAIEVGEQVARLCGRELGDAYTTWRDHIGLTRDTSGNSQSTRSTISVYAVISGDACCIDR